MKAVLLKDYEGRADSLSIAERPLPDLKPGQVLVKISASPINPSDLVFLRGEYGIIKPLPAIPGFEGSGEVVASGGGWLARMLMGKRVACHAPADGQGTWAQYMAADADSCIPLSKNISLEQGACLFVNPMTAYALLELARTRGHLAFIQTAAASAVGLMLARLGRTYGLTGIHVVRRPEQVQTLKDLGCDYVFDVNDSLFDERLGEAAYKFKATVAFDAVGGPLTARLTAAMPSHSSVIVYGALSGAVCEVNPRDLIFNQEKVEGFWLTETMKHKSFLQKILFARNVQKLLPTDLKTLVQARFPLHQAVDAISLYKKQRSSGKVLLNP